MNGNEFAIAIQSGYKQGYEDGGIKELENIKEKINSEDVNCQYEDDYVYSSGLQKAIELIDNRIKELKGEQE